MIPSTLSVSLPTRILTLSVAAFLAIAATAQAEGTTASAKANPTPASATAVANPSSSSPARVVETSALQLREDGRPASFADLAEDLLPSVVNISTLQVVELGGPNLEFPFEEGSPFEHFREFFDNQMPNDRGMPRKRRATSLGSGFIIDSEKGYIVTNHHVIKDAETITVILHDDTRVDATVIGTDDKTDLALIKVNPEGHDLKAVNWGNSDDMRVGDWILAIGNPYGLGGTVTQGIISARARDIHSGPYDDYLQTDAAINRGNSGGPMFNIHGEVIGVNTAIFSTTGGSMGIGFAVPSAIAQNVTSQLIEYGRTKRGWLGVRIQEVTPGIAESLEGFGEPRGALVASVTENSPADSAGLMPGDVILSFDGTSVEEMRELPRLVAETKVGRDTTVTLWRDGKTMEVQLRVGELEVAEEKGLVDSGSANDDPRDSVEGEKMYGLTLAPITGAIRKDFGLASDTKGVIITEIDPESPAIDENLQTGDVIMEADQKKVRTPEEFKQIADEVKESGRNSLFLLVDHQGDMIFVALPLEDPLKENDKQEE